MVLLAGGINSDVRQSLMTRYIELHALYKHTPKIHLLQEAEHSILLGNYSKAESILKEFKTKDQLLDAMYELIKHKPVYKSLKKLTKGTSKNYYEGLKGLFSLGTHMAIECEKGNVEYRALIIDLVQGIQQQLAETA